MTAATGLKLVERDAGADGGILVLSQGGARLSIDGAPTLAAEDREYRNLYARFARLIAEGRSDVDLAPLTHVADAFLLGRRIEVEAHLADNPALAARAMADLRIRDELRLALAGRRAPGRPETTEAARRLGRGLARDRLEFEEESDGTRATTHDDHRLVTELFR